MFSLDRRDKRPLLSFRLVGGYFILFFASTFFLFGLSVFLLDSYIKDIERERISEKVEGYGKRFESEGISGLATVLREHHRYNRQSDTYVHLLDDSRGTVWLTVPDEFDDLPSASFSSIGIIDAWQVVDLPTVEELDVFSLRLSNGFILQIGRTTQRQEFLVESLGGVLMIALGGMVLFGIGGGVVLAIQVRRPVRKLAQTVEEVTSGDMSSRVPVNDRRGELDELAALFNVMLQRIETLVVTTRNTLDNVGHDLRTPLARMKAKVERAIVNEVSPEEQREALMDCAEEIERINGLITMLMDVAEAETGQMKLDKQRLQIKGILQEIAELYDMVAEEKRIQINVEAGEVEVSADRQRLLQAVGNLVDNALKYTPENGSVVLQAMHLGNKVIIKVEDTGPGIPDDERERIFDKLYRLDKSRSTKGLGLGLSLVQAVVHAHGGTVCASSAESGGSTFTIKLPVN